MNQGLSFPSSLRLDYFYHENQIELKLTELSQMIKATANPSPTQLKSSNSSRNSQKIRKVQIFIGNLDIQLSNAYKKLRVSKQKSIKKQQSNSKSQYGAVSKQKLSQSNNINALKKIRKIELTQKNCPNSVIQCNQSQENQMLTPINSHKKLGKRQSQEQSIVLIPNQEVVKYINFVYDKYKIKDPLQNGIKSQTKQIFKQAGKRSTSFTKKKILQLKSNFKQSLNSVSTLKKNVKSQKIQFDNFQFEEESTMLERTLKIDVRHLNKDIILSQQDKNREISQNYNSMQVNSNIGENFRKKIKINKQNVTPVRGTNIETEYLNFVPQVFRYCFMCEEQILQCNLSGHEEVCKPLQEAYQLSFGKILEILDQKIQKYVVSIDKNFVKLKEQEIGSQIAAIKENTQSWLQSIHSQKMGNSTLRLIESKCSQGQSTDFVRMPLSARQTITSSNWRDKFGKIEESVNQSIFKSFEVINKLNWFVRLRDNLTGHYFN